MTQQPRPHVALVLSGGAIRSIAHAGVLAVLQEADIPIHSIVAASTGAVVAAAYACGTLPLLQADLVRRPPFLSVARLLALGGWERGLIDGDVYRRDLLRYTRGLQFADLPLPIACVATDLATGEAVVLDSGDVATALQASLAFPGLYPAVCVDGRLLADGGIVNLLPDQIARERGADIVIAVESVRDHPNNLFTVQQQYRRARAAWYGLLPAGTTRFVRRFVTHMTNLPQMHPFQAALEVVGVRDQPATLRRSVAGVTALTIEWLKAKHQQAYARATDVFIQPNILHIDRLEFRGAVFSAAEGRRAAEAALPQIRTLLTQWTKHGTT